MGVLKGKVYICTCGHRLNIKGVSPGKGGSLLRGVAGDKGTSMTFVTFPSPLRLKALKTDSQHRRDPGPRGGFPLLTQGTKYNRGQLCPQDQNSRSVRPAILAMKSDTHGSPVVAQVVRKQYEGWRPRGFWHQWCPLHPRGVGWPSTLECSVSMEPCWLARSLTVPLPSPSGGCPPPGRSSSPLPCLGRPYMPCSCVAPKMNRAEDIRTSFISQLHMCSFQPPPG